MNGWIIAAALLLVTLGALHSYLGERLLIGPLLGNFPEVPLGGTFAKRTLRWAWHLTTLTFVALGATVVWPQAVGDVVAIAMLLTAVVLAFGTRGAHFAWPLFAAVAALLVIAVHGASFFVAVEKPAAIALATTLGAISALHVFWAAGGRWGIDGALPTIPGGIPAFIPGRLMTIGVAVGLATMALVALAAAEVIHAPGQHNVYRIGTALIGAVFLLRAFGDGRYVGFFKHKVGSVFARRDTAFYTPLCVLLGLTSLAVALLER